MNAPQHMIAQEPQAPTNGRHFAMLPHGLRVFIHSFAQVMKYVIHI